MFSIYKTSLTKEEKEKMVGDILKLFNNGDWCINHPPYQTWPVLFDYLDSHWVNLKNSFVSAVKLATNVNPIFTKCWTYTNFAKKEISNEHLWHNHVDNFPELNPEKVICGCFYLSLPEGSFVTEYKIDGIIKNMPYEENSWTLFPGKLLHRPGKWNAEKINYHRIVLSADAVIE